jgi:outer membrane phospholipase A
MFRAIMCPSSGDNNCINTTPGICHSVWMTDRRSPTQIDKYQVSYWYSYFSWWWAHSCPKYVENRNKHARKELCTRLVLFTRLYKDARWTKRKKTHTHTHTYWQRITETASEPFFPSLYRELQCTLLNLWPQSFMQGDSGGKDSSSVADSISNCEEECIWTCV